MKKYQVIGGQYEAHWYGESDSLRGAKQIASNHAEYWDNWQGWHTPKIYTRNDVEEITTHGWITCADGMMVRVAKQDAPPVAVKINGRWETND